MGLDSYLETGDERQIKYWRNHLMLHAWMNRLVNEKRYTISRGDEDDEDDPRDADDLYQPGKFLPGRFQLSLEDLKALQAHINAQRSEDWMRNIDRRYDRVDDLDVVADAIELLKQGETIWYFSNW